MGKSLYILRKKFYLFMLIWVDSSDDSHIYELLIPKILTSTKDYPSLKN